jgi:anti-sigma-K factor RskA
LKNYQYLTDGVIESYLLGLVSDGEKREVERLLTTDPDVLSQLNELETEMEDHFLRSAVPPPPAVRMAILDELNKTDLIKRDRNQNDYTRFKQESPKPDYVDVEVNNTHIQVHKYWRPAFIAVFVLSKVFLIAGLYYYFKTSSLEQEIIRLKATTQQTAPMTPSKTP